MADDRKAAGDNHPEELSTTNNVASSTTNGDDNPVTEIQQRSPPADDVIQEAPAAKRPRTESEGEVNPAAAVRAFRSLRGDLMTAIVDALPLANTLYSKFMIPESTMNRVSVPCLTKEEKNVALLVAIEARLQTNPSDFWTLVAVLEADPILQIFADKLKESYYLTRASHESPTPVPCSPGIARYADYLKAYYRTAPIAPDIPECCKWPLTPSTQFINLAVVKKKRVSRAKADKFTKATLHGNIDEILKVKKAIKMEDVLKPEGEAEVKCVMVEGAPGVGKSTFAWELCRRWDEIEAMRKYSVVVLLRLREKRVQEAKTVADLFYHDSLTIQQAVAEEIALNGGADTLLVLDGFDEVPASLQKSSLLVQIIQGACLPKATVLVTSRPSARVDLLSVCKPRVHKHIEVLGFTQKLIKQYAKSIFASHPSLLADFLKYISTNPAIRSMMYIPLNSAIVVEIYRENRTVGRPIPQTMTQLYNELTLTLLARYMSEKGEQSVLPEKLEALPRNLYRQLLSLATLAFEGIVKQVVIFDRLPDGCSPLGLMNASAEIYVRGRRVNYNFLHLTLQEFLSAFYVSRLSASQQKKVFERYSAVVVQVDRVEEEDDDSAEEEDDDSAEEEDDDSAEEEEEEEKGEEEEVPEEEEEDDDSAEEEEEEEKGEGEDKKERGKGEDDVSGDDREDVVGEKVDFSRMEVVWRFVAGLTGFKEIGWDVVQSRGGRDKYGHVAPFLVHCLYEAQEEVDCESVLGGSKVTFGGPGTGFDCFAVGYCIAVSKCCWQWSGHYNCLGAESVEMLVSGMKSKVEVRGSIEALNLRDNPIKREGVAHLKEMPHKVLQQISWVDLCKCKLDRAALNLLSDIIPIMTSLKHLNISNNPAGDGGTVKLLQALGHLHSLHTLDMYNTNIGCDDIMALSQLISPTGYLQELMIGDRNMPPECVQLMMKTVLSPSSLEVLNVWGVDLTFYGNCFSPLAENHNLARLELGCKCGGEVVSCLASSLFNNSTLRVLQMGYQSGNEGAILCSKMLKVNRSLEEFGFPNREHSEVCAIIDSLQHNHTLKILYINKKSRKYFSRAAISAMDPRVTFETFVH